MDGQATAAHLNSISSMTVVPQNAEDMVDTEWTETVNKYPEEKKDVILLNLQTPQLQCFSRVSEKTTTAKLRSIALLINALSKCRRFRNKMP